MSLPPTKIQLPKKAFGVVPCTGQNEGEKIILYAASGMGKTTLASMLPNPVFISVDGGARKIRNPKTGEPLNAVSNVNTFDDVRKVLSDITLLKDFDTVVIDHITELERLALPYVFNTVLKEKGGKATNVEDYGWHKGYRYWYDTMRLILQSCDALVRAGKNVCLVAQASTIKIANPGGEDFLQEAPELYHDRNVSTLNQYVSWADHVLRIAYSHVAVSHAKAGTSGVRAVFVHSSEIYYIAKSRSIGQQYPLVSFEKPDDDSIWKILFGEK